MSTIGRKVFLTVSAQPDNHGAIGPTRPRSQDRRNVLEAIVSDTSE